LILTNNSTLCVVVALALISGEGRVLLQRRNSEGLHGGLWEFPGGKVDAGESPDSAVLREIEEEIGLRLAPEAVRPFTFSAGPRDPRTPEEQLVILLYTCRNWTGEPRCLAGHEIAWFEAEETTGLGMPPLDYPLAKNLASALARDSI